MPRHVLNLDDTREVFRRKILAALDEAARETFDPSRNDAGAADADLPRLFKAIDAQIEVLAERYGATLVDPIRPVTKSGSVECPHCHWGFAPVAIAQHIREKH